jgi:hypothetical protein
MALAVVCALQFFMLRNLKEALTVQTQSAEARIVNLENAVAKIVHRLNTARTVPVVTSELR